ncbi:phBC6A51 family helix-turn-helix protein [Brevibacillus daliensis]|uniref:phBC6A51 family helix-turn-helix protein n=1 Tax=Brevibacillus daliensis TaxID=2892995 RepID=UPI001E5695F1|nr:phBC6A51 family helix-turn-helix protein [Brevibacillus daliensis]
MAKRLSAEQYLAIGYLAQPKRAGMTMEEVANECGVARKTIYEWKKLPHFDAELKRQIQLSVSDRVPDVIDAMVRTSVSEGNAAAAKLILQVAGMLTDKVEVETKSATEIPDIDELKRMVAEMDV